MENSEEKEDCTAEDLRKKKLELKLRKLKLRKSLNQQRMMGPSSININALYEMRLQKLRTNNKALAKELADKKTEISQLYNEVILLKGELQEANERALRSGDTNYEKAIDQEVERRMKDIGEPLSEAISHALTTVLGVVESFSKVKQLSARFNSARLSSSTISLPRSSLSRTPLGCGSNSSSPCQSVRPMVGGYVLQPAMVSIEKLDDIWQARLKARIQARETQLVDMSAIGEQSLSADEANESSTSKDVNLSNEGDSTALNVSRDGVKQDSSPISPSTPVRGRRGKQSRDKNPAASKSPLSTMNVSPTANESPLQSRDDERQSTPDDKTGSPSVFPLEKDDDPLEGPSWWYSETSQRGRGRGRNRSRGGKRGRPSTKAARLSSVGSRASRSSVGKTVEIANEEGRDETINNLETASEGASKAPENLSDLPDSPVLSVDLSYLASPATMLTRLENLEKKSGRRTKSKSKGRSLRVSCVDSLPKQQQEVADAVLGNDSLLSKPKEFHSNKDREREQEKMQESSFKMPLPVSDGDFFIQDSDLTCIVDESMDMTEPISKIFLQAAAELKAPKASQCQNANTDKKFFKNDSAFQSQILATQGKTPFDLSLMDDTYMAIPAYSSQKTLEKENMPPLDEDTTKTKTVDPEKEVVSLRRISIVLEDVMKSAELHHSLQEVAVSSSSYQRSLNSSKEKCDGLEVIDPDAEGVGIKGTSRKRRNLKYSKFGSPNEEEEEDTDDNWSPNISKKGRMSKSRKTSQRSGKASFPKRRGTKSEIVLSPAKGKRRTNKSESGISLAQATTSVGINIEDDNKSIMEANESETVSSQRHSSHDSPGNNLVRGLNKCYVKIYRTPEYESIKHVVDEGEDCTMPEELPDFGILLKEAEGTDDVGAAKSENQEESESEQHLEDEDEQPKELDAATCDHIVPDQFERSEDSKEDKKNDVDTGSEDGISVASEAATESNADCNNEADADDILEVGNSRRKRGAAMKISSFKEPGLNTKMRNPEIKRSSGPKPKVKLNRKSGVKMAAS